VLEFKAGHADKAISLWQDALWRAPGRSAIGMNLVRVLCAGSQFEKARTNVSRVWNSIRIYRWRCNCRNR